jgi:hypothetical protein
LAVVSRSPISTAAHLDATGLSNERRELLCSVIGLTVKIGVSCVALVSLCRISGTYQERLDRNGELSAILDIENAKLNKAQERFDSLFATDGEQRLIREQDQWISPNRLRVVWEAAKNPFPSVERHAARAGKTGVRP